MESFISHIDSDIQNNIFEHDYTDICMHIKEKTESVY